MPKYRAQKDGSDNNAGKQEEKRPMEENKTKALQAALAQIEKQFGKGSIMRMDSAAVTDIDVVSTGSLGLDIALTIETPLMWMDKAATWQMAHDLGGQPLIDLITEHTHTCYTGARNQRHPWGYGCGACPACELRAAGWFKYAQSLSFR